MSPHKPLSGWRVSRVALAVLLALACSHAAHANAWTNGQVITYTQSDWGAGGSAATLLSTNFISVYPSALVVVGERATGFTMAFDNAASISSYLPTSGSAGVSIRTLSIPAPPHREHSVETYWRYNSTLISPTQE